MSAHKGFNNRYAKILLAFVIGLIVGFIALVYNNILDYFTFSLIDIGMELTIFNRLTFLFLPAIGGLVVGFIIKYGSMSAKGHGIPAILSSIETKERHLTYRDLLTEGLLTLNKVLSLLKDYKPGQIPVEGKDGASRFTRLLLESDSVKFYVGRAVNESHQSLNLPIDLGIRSQIISQIAEQLQRIKKEVKIEWF